MGAKSEMKKGVMERLKQDYAGIIKAQQLMDTIAAIAYQGMIAADGSQYSHEGMVKILENMESPWGPEHLQENTYLIILKLAGEAWQEINECADPESLFSDKESAPEPQAAPEGGE